MRKLASIRRISEIKPIEGADFLELAIVDGWQCVVRKDQFEVDELVIYCEIDSCLPIREELEFLRKSCYVKKDWLVSEQNPTGEGFRLKTIRLRNQISQGLLLKLDFLHAMIENKEIKSVGWNEGLDVTEWCEIVKWDPPIPAQLAGKVRGNFPSFISKTDQERIQNIALDKLPNLYNYEISLKMDGSSMTVYRNEDRTGICSRNLDLDVDGSPDTSFVRVAKEYGLIEFLNSYNVNLAFQGELMGPGVQGNRENLKEAEMFVFDIYDINNQKYVDCHERYEWMKILNEYQETFSFKKSRHVETYGITKGLDKLETYLEMAKGPSLNHPVREGLVFKSIENPNFSFKAINNEFLLGNDE